MGVVSAQRGCLARGGMSAHRATVCPGGGVVSARGACLPKGGVCLGCVHPPVNRITDRCKNLSATPVADGI